MVSPPLPKLDWDLLFTWLSPDACLAAGSVTALPRCPEAVADFAVLPHPHETALLLLISQISFDCLAAGSCVLMSSAWVLFMILECEQLQVVLVLNSVLPNTKMSFPTNVIWWPSATSEHNILAKTLDCPISWVFTFMSTAGEVGLSAKGSGNADESQSLYQKGHYGKVSRKQS